MRRWLAAAFGMTLALFGAIGAIAAAGDVFAIFGTRLFAHNLGSLELRLTTNGDRVIKGLEYFRRTKTLDIVFLGSSRAAFGFDPHTATMAGLNAYNAGLNGSHSNESADILKTMAGRTPKVRRVIWAVDFEEFFRETAAPGDLAESVFGGASPWRGRLMHALSYEALRKTIGGQTGAQAFYIDTDGFYHYALQDRKRLISGDDFWELPSMRAWFPSYMYVPRDTYAEQLQPRLQRMVEAIRAARERNIAVDIVLPPVHVSRRAMFDLLGYQQRFRDWKKALAAAVGKAAEGPGAPVRAIDFSEVGEVALGSFRRGGPLDRSPWFFEVLHFRPSVGDMIVARVMDRPWPADIAPFGAPLAETTTDARLSADEAQVAIWEQRHPELVAGIRAVIASFEKYRIKS
ncbi:MAG: hypothetical protein ACK5JM_13650 [Rhodoblastus sp.]